MKRWLITATFSLALLIGGCSANPAAAPGPPGPQGQQGAPAPDTDRDRKAQEERDREQAQQGTTPTCPAGEHLYKDPSDGRTTCVRD